MENRFWMFAAIASMIVQIATILLVYDYFNKKVLYDSIDIVEDPVITIADPSINPHIDKIEQIELLAGMELSGTVEYVIREEEGISYIPYLIGENVHLGIGRNLTGNGISMAELIAISPNPPYKVIFESATVKNGRVYISDLPTARQIFPVKLSSHDIHLLFIDDLRIIEEEAEQVFGSVWNEIDQTRKEAILDMIYNLGLPHFKSFHKFIADVRVKDWNAAASEVLLSEAAQENIDRYNRIYNIIRTGDERYFNLR